MTNDLKKMLFSGEPLQVLFKFVTSGECNQMSETPVYLSDVSKPTLLLSCFIAFETNRLLLQNQFVIIPTMDLTHPADQLIQGCTYEIVIEDEVFNNHKNQTYHYEIPGKFFIVTKQTCTIIS